MRCPPEPTEAPPPTPNTETPTPTGTGIGIGRNPVSTGSRKSFPPRGSGPKPTSNTVKSSTSSAWTRAAKIEMSASSSKPTSRPFAPRNPDVANSRSDALSRDVESNDPKPDTSTPNRLSTTRLAFPNTPTVSPGLMEPGAPAATPLWDYCNACAVASRCYFVVLLASISPRRSNPHLEQVRSATSGSLTGRLNRPHFTFRSVTSFPQLGHRNMRIPMTVAPNANATTTTVKYG